MRRIVLQFILGLALVASVPIAGAALRGVPEQRCTADGVPLADAPVVRIVESEGRSRSFCCIGCAETWLRDVDVRPSQVWVTDEISQEPVDVADAWFVHSPVPAQPATLDRVHTFRSREDAERHARSYRGRILVGEERPFRGVQ